MTTIHAPRVSVSTSPIIRGIKQISLTPRTPIHCHYASSRFCWIQFTLFCEIGPTRFASLCVLMSERQTAPKRLLANTGKLLNGRVRVLASPPRKDAKKEILMLHCGSGTKRRTVITAKDVDRAGERESRLSGGSD